MIEQPWTAALDELEQRLAGHRALLAADLSPEAGPWTPPSRLGPVPEACLPRARALLRELDQVVEQLDQARARTRRGLRLHRALPSRGPGESAYVDVRS